jgi:hypothetical protein
LGGCFQIEWISYAFLSFSRLEHVSNPLNGNEPIKKSRDTQELPASIGKTICLMFDIPVLENKELAKLEKNGDEEDSSEDVFDIKVKEQAHEYSWSYGRKGRDRRRRGYGPRGDRDNTKDEAKYANNDNGPMKGYQSGHGHHNSAVNLKLKNSCLPSKV